MKSDGFDWDAGNWPKCGKHGLSQDEIEQVLSKPVHVLEDPSPAEMERRYRAIGTTGAVRHVLVVFCIRRFGRMTLVRPISAVSCIARR